MKILFILNNLYATGNGLSASARRTVEALKTKDSYGRDIVDPARGIYIRFGEFGESAVEVAVKQYVLVPERIAYVDRCKELVYKVLNEGGITIPFPQCDVHMKND